MRRIFVVALCSLLATIAHAATVAPWRLDVTRDLSPPLLATDDAGRVYVGSPDGLLDDEPFQLLARLTVDGRRDASFQVSGITGYPQAIAFAPDGRIYVSGELEVAGTFARVAIARLDANGRYDAAWTPVIGAAGTPSVQRLAATSRGLLLAGDFSSISGQGRPGLARITWDGLLDVSFNPAVTPPVAAIGADAQGDVFAQMLGGPLVKLDGTTGANAWNGGGVETDAFLLGVLGDAFYAATDQGMLKFDGATGQPLPFTAIPIAGEPKVFTEGAIYQIERQGSSGALFYVLRRYDAGSGELDTGFSARFDSYVTSAAVSGDGLVLGSTRRAGDALASGIHRVVGRGFDDTFRPVLRRAGAPFAVRRAPDGDFALSGDFDRIAGADRRGVAKLRAPSLALDQVWTSSLASYVVADTAFAGSSLILAGGLFVENEPESRPIAKLDWSTGLFDAAWAQPSSWPVFTQYPQLLATGPDRVVVAGFEGSLCGQAAAPLLRIVTVASCEIDSTFSSDVQPRVIAVAPSSGDALLASRLTAPFYFQSVIERRLPEGAADPGWHIAAVDGRVFGMLETSDGVYVRGTFTALDGVPRRFLARLRHDGTLDPSWHATVSGSVDEIGLAPDGDLLVALFDGHGSTIVEKRTRGDGSLDERFLVRVSGRVWGIEAVAGQVLLVGTFDTVQGERRTSLALIDPDGVFANSFE